KKGIARDIISEARSGYGTVVIGRRGLSGIEEFFLGSVSQKVLHSLRAISIIIVN
ncbi:MAG: universal stress protein, partial [Deltaproteobacteria bacterium]|nr:universal stress protein [Deltaproteobacteria bacterium]